MRKFLLGLSATLVLSITCLSANATLQSTPNITCLHFCTHEQYLTKFVSKFPDGSKIPLIVNFYSHPVPYDFRSSKNLDYTGELELIKSYGGNVTGTLQSDHVLLANIPKDKVFALMNDPRIQSIDADRVSNAGSENTDNFQGSFGVTSLNGTVVPSPNDTRINSTGNSVNHYPNFTNNSSILPTSTGIGFGTNTSQNTIKQTENQSLGGNTPSYISPLKQIKSGILPKDVKCKNGLLLIIKKSNGIPVCIKPHAAQSFVERNWGITDNYFIPKVSQDETIKIVKDDLRKHLPNLDKVIIFGIDPIPNYPDYPRHSLQLIYAIPNGTESIINSTDYSLAEKCNTKVTMCLLDNKLQLAAIQNRTSYLVDLNWSTKTGLSLPTFYIVDAQGGNILYSTLGENIPQDAKAEYKP